MKQIFILTFLCSIYTYSSFAQTPVFNWAGQLGNNVVAYAWENAIDASGNIYTTGFFWETVDFDPGPGTYDLTSFGARDAFISKLDASGNFVWAKQLAGGQYEEADGIAVDHSGNVYTVGHFDNTADFDPGAGTYNLTPIGIEDAFVSKLDSNGNFVWAKQFGGTEFCFGVSISLDNSGDVYIAGGFTLTADFDPGSGIFNLTSVNNLDNFVVKLDVSGNFIWAIQFEGSTGYEEIEKMTCDEGGNVYVTGYMDDTVDFDPGPGIYDLASVGQEDFFICKLDSSGNFVWADHVGGDYIDEGRSIALDHDNNVLVCGSFNDTVDFDPGPGVYLMKGGGGYILKLDNSGSFIWARQIKGVGYGSGGSALDITCDATDNVYFTGTFAGTIDCDPDSLSAFDLTVSGYQDVFVEKLNSSGDFGWAFRIGKQGLDDGHAIVTDGAGNIYVAGNFVGNNVDFDPGPGTFNLSAGPDGAVFVLKVSDLATGLTENNFDDEVTVFPNPNNGDFKINLGKEYGDVIVRFTDIAGREIFSSTFREAKTLDVKNNFRPGLYIAEITTSDKKVARVKVITQ